MLIVRESELAQRPQQICDGDDEDALVRADNLPSGGVPSQSGPQRAEDAPLLLAQSQFRYLKTPDYYCVSISEGWGSFKGDVWSM